VLVPGDTSEIVVALETLGARVITCPPIDVGPPESITPLDDAIGNLYGYDWIIFSSAHGVDYFLRRLKEIDHQVDELDPLRVCAVGLETAHALEVAHVHVDVIPSRPTINTVFDAIATYIGQPEGLRGLTFLLPRAVIASDQLPRALEDAGARVDVVATHRTVKSTGTELTNIRTLLAGGGIDCVVFSKPADVDSFGELFDTNDLSGILSGCVVACLDESCAHAASARGLQSTVTPNEATPSALARAIAGQLS